MTGELPDLFRMENGSRVRTAADWRRRRDELWRVLQEVEYGHMPPAPATVTGELVMRNNAAEYGARQLMYRVRAGDGSAAGSVGFVLDLYLPAGDGPFPVMLDGDACWPIMTPEKARLLMGRGYVLAWFNRLEFAGDTKETAGRGGLYHLHDGDYGALAAWAWGYSRALDFLATLDFVAADRVIAVGASRGGKAALLAVAADERFAMAAPNNSGCCGAGCFRHLGPKAETLADMIEHAGFWLSPRLADYVGREGELPLDQHFLKALIAPRPLLTTEALGDLNANPTGTWLTHAAAREAWRFLGAEQRCGIWYRAGRHEHTPADWQAALDFADWHLHNRPPADLDAFNTCPFDDLPAAHTWSAPAPVGA